MKSSKVGRVIGDRSQLLWGVIGRQGAGRRDLGCQSSHVNACMVRHLERGGARARPRSTGRANRSHVSSFETHADDPSAGTHVVVRKSESEIRAVVVRLLIHFGAGPLARLTDVFENSVRSTLTGTRVLLFLCRGTCGFFFPTVLRPWIHSMSIERYIFPLLRLAVESVACCHLNTHRPAFDPRLGCFFASTRTRPLCSTTIDRVQMPPILGPLQARSTDRHSHRIPELPERPPISISFDRPRVTNHPLLRSII